VQFSGSAPASTLTLDASGNLLVGGTAQSGTANRAAVFSANKFGLSIIDTTAQATGVGGALNLGGNYRSAGDAQAFCRVAAAKENSTDTNFAYAMTFATTPNGGTFTEGARITSGGDLLVGKTATTFSDNGIVLFSTADASGARINVTNTSEASLNLNRLSTDGTIASFSRSTTSVGSISVTTVATSFNTTSDQRLKENIVDAPDFGSVIDSIQVRSFDWKANSTNQRAGFVAQELLTVAPEAVHQPADPEEMMAVDYSKLVPMLVKEIQSLRARVAALEA
jgi:hypothetical protein